MRTLLKAIPAAALLCLATHANADTLSAGYAGGNFNDGIMFDVQALKGVTLTSIDINADPGTFDYEVFYRLGGSAGFQTDASAWTSLGTFAATTANGLGVATTLDFTDLALTSGSIYGFYIVDTGGAFTVNYSNSLAASGSVQVANADLQLRVGYGIDGQFGGAIDDREFNGALNYTVQAVPEPAAWAMMVGGFGLIGGYTRRRKQRTAAATA